MKTLTIILSVIVILLSGCQEKTYKLTILSHSFSKTLPDELVELNLPISIENVTYKPDTSSSLCLLDTNAVFRTQIFENKTYAWKKKLGMKVSADKVKECLKGLVVPDYMKRKDTCITSSKFLEYLTKRKIKTFTLYNSEKKDSVIIGSKKYKVYQTTSELKTHISELITKEVETIYIFYNVNITNYKKTDSILNSKIEDQHKAVQNPNLGNEGVFDTKILKEITNSVASIKQATKDKKPVTEVMSKLSESYDLFLKNQNADCYNKLKENYAKFKDKTH